jgi:hypothetical protein
VTLRYLPVHAENALLALDLARKEALLAARDASQMLFHAVAAIEAQAALVGLTGKTASHPC